MGAAGLASRRRRPVSGCFELRPSSVSTPSPCCSPSSLLPQPNPQPPPHTHTHTRTHTHQPAEAQEFKAKYEAAEKANAEILGTTGAATATKGDAEADAEADALADELTGKAGVKDDDDDEEDEEDDA